MSRNIQPYGGELEEKPILIVAGTRPEIIKLFSVIKWLENLHADYIFVWSGQHYDYEMSRLFFEELRLPEPHINLNVMSGSHAEQTAKIIMGVEEVIQKVKPAVTVAQGDTNTVLAAALASTKMQVPFAHIEAGLRSWNLAMPEEINRKVADSIAQICFAPTKLAALNLIFEGVSQNNIVITGNTVVDILLEYIDVARDRGRMLLDKLGVEKENYALLTIHRAENTDNPNRLGSIIRAVNKLSQEIKIIFPIHPRTQKIMKKNNMLKHLSQNIVLLPPLGYIEFLGILNYSRVVLTDSGGVQEEAFILKVPTVTLRYNTERPETVLLGVNKLAGCDEDSIIRASLSQLSRYDEIKKATLPPVFGDGKAGERIAKILLQRKDQLKIAEPDMRSCITFIHAISPPEKSISSKSEAGETIAVFDGKGLPDLPVQDKTLEDIYLKLLKRCITGYYSSLIEKLIS